MFSALSTSFTVLFLFWTITHFAGKIAFRSGEYDTGSIAAVMITGVIGALTATFITSMWFSAVEAEVYALATFFFALAWWAMTKWERAADEPYADRWIIFIALMLGLSGGVHLLSFLAIPAITFMYYLKKYKPTYKGLAATFGVSILILGLILFGLLDGFIAMAAGLEVWMVNDVGAPFYSGIILFSALFVRRRLSMEFTIPSKPKDKR